MTSVLFTSISVEPVINIIQHRLEKDRTLIKDHINSTDIKQLVGFCLHNTYFLFKGQFCEQVEGAAMGLPVDPIMADSYMEYFEDRTFRTAENATSY